MTNRKSLILALLTVVFAASIALAQHRNGPPDPATMVQHHVQHLTTVLSLTPAQQQQATTLLTNVMTGASSIHNDMKTAHQSLQTAIKSNDENGISQAATTIGNLTAQMVSAHAKAMAAFRQVLTPEQQTKLDQLASEHEGMGGMGMGMGMGFGGPEHHIH